MTLIEYLYKFVGIIEKFVQKYVFPNYSEILTCWCTMTIKYSCAEKTTKCKYIYAQN